MVTAREQFLHSAASLDLGVTKLFPDGPWALHNVIHVMRLRSALFGGRLVGLLLAVVLLVAPLDGLLHLMEEVRAESSHVCHDDGPVVEAACGDGPCHDPGHEHRHDHDHDVASCARCGVLFHAFDAPVSRGLAVVVPATRAALGIVPSAEQSSASGVRPPSRAPPAFDPLFAGRT